MFAALRHRDFRLLWAGLLLSFTGTFMQSAAMLWHVSLLAPEGKRALALGVVGLARIGPILLFSMISGVAADALEPPRPDAGHAVGDGAARGRSRGADGPRA